VRLLDLVRLVAAGCAALEDVLVRVRTTNVPCSLIRQIASSSSIERCSMERTGPRCALDALGAMRVDRNVDASRATSTAARISSGVVGHRRVCVRGHDATRREQLDPVRAVPVFSRTLRGSHPGRPRYRNSDRP
jgi:hypothetical protein